MALWIKQGVCGELTREAANGLRKTKGLFGGWGEDVFVTSIRDGTHGNYSLHPQGDAWDMRYPKRWSKAKAGLLVAVLGGDFDVVFEKTHIHVEFDPK